MRPSRTVEPTDDKSDGFRFLDLAKPEVHYTFGFHSR